MQADKKQKKVKAYLGGCLCGSIRFEATATAEKPHTCSCKMCQRHTGSLTTAWVEFPKDSIKWVGPGGMPALYRSSQGSSRAFCPVCGSSLGAVDDQPVIALLLGVFDSLGRQELVPAYHSYRTGQPKWWHVDISPTIKSK